MAKVTGSQVRRKIKKVFIRPELRGFAKRVTESRVSAKLTQLELAARIGCHPQIVSRYERAECMPKTTERLLDLAKVTGVRFEWLATGRGPMREAA